MSGNHWPGPLGPMGASSGWWPALLDPMWRLPAEASGEGGCQGQLEKITYSTREISYSTGKFNIIDI